MTHDFPAGRAMALATIAALSGCSVTEELAPVTAGAGAYTEAREPCAQHDPLMHAYFGELHTHTALSFDAWTYDVRTTPSDAYRFARGETIYLPPLDANGNPTRPVKLDRPLDFAAVTDHSEYLGEVSICTTPGSPGYDSSICQAYRPPTSSFLDFGVGTTTERAPFCGDGGAVCLAAARPVWQGVQGAAEAAYDRTAACSFTTFVAYEYTLSPLGSNLHRNIIFRNAHALPAPITAYEAPTPVELWTELKATCIDAGTGCDVLAIPHNSDLSNGRMFRVEYLGTSGVAEQRERAKLRAEMEPIVEIFQHKGDSECLNGLTSFPGAPDELCGFEKVVNPPIFDCGPTGVGIGGLGGIGCTSWLDYVRNAWKAGLSEGARLGVNPYKLGVIASTDTHNGTPGNVDEATFQGHLGVADQDPSKALMGKTIAGTPLISNPGGLAGVWAEENSRDAIFKALRRRETFGTSGPRITVRLFAGWAYPEDICSDPEMVRKGYEGGVPMGGDIPPRPPSGVAPRLVVSAMRDPGTPSRPGVKLQRLQVIKVWIDKDGAPREEVFDVAGDPNNGATVDPLTCAPAGPGADSLCAVWIDPTWSISEPAAYYLRAVENPSCRWSTYVCNALPADQQAALHCDNLGVPRTIQERAWSSPVWYTP